MKDLLTALVPTALWSAAKNNVAAQRRIMYQVKEGKCFGLKENTLLKVGFTPGHSPSRPYFIYMRLNVRQQIMFQKKRVKKISNARHLFSKV